MNRQVKSLSIEDVLKFPGTELNYTPSFLQERKLNAHTYDVNGQHLLVGYHGSMPDPSKPLNGNIAVVQLISSIPQPMDICVTYRVRDGKVLPGIGKESFIFAISRGTGGPFRAENTTSMDQPYTLSLSMNSSIPREFACIVNNGSLRGRYEFESSRLTPQIPGFDLSNPNHAMPWMERVGKLILQSNKIGSTTPYVVLPEQKIAK